MWPAGFDPQPTWTGSTLHLRPLAQDDLEALYTAASDPLIWEQHPKNTRHQRDVFETYFAHLLKTRAALVIMDRATDRVIGTSSYYMTNEDPPGASVGFTFIERAYWGGETNRELKTLMFNHLFQSFDTAWLHVNRGNVRSQRGTAKLGAERVGIRQLDLGAGPADYVTFRLTRDQWQNRHG